jgi:hypothetical protein
MSNRLSSYPASSPASPLHRFGGVLASTPELPMTAIGDAYVVEGTGTVRSLPAWPKGPPILLHIIGNPTFVHSSRLLMPGAQNYTFSPGDSAWLMPLGDMVWRVISISRADGIPYIPASKTLFPAPQGRLTATPGTPETSTDVTGAGTVLYTPRDGQLVALFDGKTWVQVEFPETPLSLSGAPAAKMFDVFGYTSGNSMALESLMWTSDTARATAITQWNGIDVKSGDPSRRLLGSFRTTGMTGQTEDSRAKRYVSNRYNDVPRFMRVLESSFTWNYSLATWRQVNGSAGNQIDCALCVPRQVQAFATGFASSSAAANMAVGIGVNGVPAASDATMWVGGSTANQGVPMSAYYAGVAGSGRNFFTWIEIGFGAGTQTFQGANLPLLQTGIVGMVSN